MVQYNESVSYKLADDGQVLLGVSKLSCQCLHAMSMLHKAPSVCSKDNTNLQTFIVSFSAAYAGASGGVVPNHLSLTAYTVPLTLSFASLVMTANPSLRIIA